MNNVFLVFLYLATNGDNKLYIANKIYYTSQENKCINTHKQFGDKMSHT